MDLLATSEDLRNFLGTEEIDLARADMFLAAISSEVRKFTDITFEMEEDQVVTLDGSGTSVVLLPALPVLEVTSVTEGGSELAETAYEWNSKGILRKTWGVWAQRFRNLVVTYTHGFDEVPDEIRLFVCRVAARGFVNPTAVTNEAMGGYSAGYGYDETRMPTLSEGDRNFLRVYMGR